VDVRVNGKTKTMQDGATVSDLVVALGLDTKRVVVERNGEPVKRSSFAAVRLASGDVLEVVRAVPGG
jgi:thiamine biosynthesis protein ThiS